MSRPTGLRVEFYRDVHDKWRWAQFAENGRIRASSSESFESEANARKNWRDGLTEGLSIVDTGEVYHKSETLEFTRKPFNR
jgi:hypothetical protein